MVPCVSGDPSGRKLVFVQRVTFGIRRQQRHIFVIQEYNVLTWVTIPKRLHDLWLPLSRHQPALITFALHVLAIFQKFGAICTTLNCYLRVIRRTPEQPLLLPPLRANDRPTRYITVSLNCLGLSFPNKPCDQSSSSFSTVMGSNFFPHQHMITLCPSSGYLMCF